MATVPAGLPERVTIRDVGPRDGLQNEKALVPTAVKAEFGKTLLRQDNFHSRDITLIDGHLEMRRGANDGDTADSTETAVVRCDLNIVRSDQGYAIARGMFGRKR